MTPLVTDQNEISETIDIAKPKYKPITKTFKTPKTYSKENLIMSNNSLLTTQSSKLSISL